MILKPKKILYLGWNPVASILIWILNWKFKKLVIHGIDIKPNCSYLFLSNHIGFWDGFWGAYLAYTLINKKVPMRSFFAMSVKKQLVKNQWLRYFGCFSVAPFGKSKEESIDFAAKILNKPGNILMFYPQGNLESNYIRQIDFKEGIVDILAKTDPNCQIIWTTNLIEYFESLKPSVYFHLLDCGTNENFDMQTLSVKINEHHRESIRKQFRFTSENN